MRSSNCKIIAVQEQPEKCQQMNEKPAWDENDHESKKRKGMRKYLEKSYFFRSVGVGAREKIQQRSYYAINVTLTILQNFILYKAYIEPRTLHET